MKRKIIDSSLYQKSNKLFARISALPIKKGFHVMCFIFGMMQISKFSEKELEIIEAEIIRKELEGNSSSPF